MDLTARRMKKIRQHLGLSKKSMSKICGFGENGWMRYENGDAKPNSSNSKLIKMTFRPSSMKRLMDFAPQEDIPNFDDAYSKICEAVNNIKMKERELGKIEECNFIDEI